MKQAQVKGGGGGSVWEATVRADIVPDRRTGLSPLGRARLHLNECSWYVRMQRKKFVVTCPRHHRTHHSYDNVIVVASMGKYTAAHRSAAKFVIFT